MLQITIAGRIVKDSIMRFTAAGKNVLGFTVVTDVGWGDDKHGVFVACSMWGKRAESLEPYLKKGKPVTVTGAADLRKWQTDTSSGSEITCRVSEVTMQGGKQQDTQEPQEGYRDKKPAEPAQHQQDAPDHDQQGDFADDDIPF